MPDVSSDEWTIGRLIEWTRGFFEKRDVAQPRLEAEILLAHVLGAERIDLYLRYENPVAEDERTAFRDLVRRRAAGEPTRYLVGTCEFLALAFKVTPDCLIPRPETEMLVEEVLRLSGAAPAPLLEEGEGGEGGEGGEMESSGPLTAIDLCTGCGCVAVSLAVRLPDCRVTATDISPAALEVARINAEAHGVADRVTFLEGNLYDALDAADAAPADFLLCNPPYVAEAEWDGLAREIREHEPRDALVAGPDGTEVVERILKGARAYLKPTATLLVEIGAGQGARAAETASTVRGLLDVRVLKDYAGLDRILVAQREPECPNGVRVAKP